MQHQEELLNRSRTIIRELRDKLAAREQSRGGPIAIVGMACRFPGAATNCDAFWKMTTSGAMTVTRVPRDRWDAEAFYDPEGGKPGRSSTRHGNFLQHVDRFDAAFFDISPREAVHMDPQQRIFLEVAWHALEDAGMTREHLAGSETGVFVGLHNLSADYYALQGDIRNMDMYAATGAGHDIIAGRLAYLLDLHGPSLAINTACSSSLVAVHVACNSLLAGDCRAAIVGGVNVMLTPGNNFVTSALGMLSADGRCKTFDAAADGFGRGEGCGVVVLKHLSDALKDHDQIYAVIRGSAINQDGRSNGLTAPNGLAQQALIRRALDRAGLRAAEIGYVETHGTGTPLGDPIEIEALSEVLGYDAAVPCALGAVKANVGHLEGAAGIAGLIKAALVLRHRTIPPVAGFRQLNPHLSFQGTRLSIPVSASKWEGEGHKRFAGVSSFGWSGTNAHVVLEEAPAPTPVAPHNDRAFVVTVSAADPQALRALGNAYAHALRALPVEELPDFAYTACVRRTHHSFRIAAAGTSPESIARELTEKVAQPFGDRSASAPRVALVYCGQGPQWWAMGRELLGSEPVFRRAIESCATEIRAIAGWDLMAELSASEEHSQLHQTEIAQPALFALQVGLTEWFRSRGVVPSAVTGHSLGEIAALWAAGALTLPDAIRIVVHRGSSMWAARGHGSMAAIEVGRSEIERWLRSHGTSVCVAAVNSPVSTVISGDRNAVAQLVESARERGIRAKVISNDFAFHSAQMEAASQDLEAALRGLKPCDGSMEIFSTVTGSSAQGHIFTEQYWRRNMRQPVLFASAIETMLGAGYNCFVEIGPNPVVSSMLAQCLSPQHEHVSILPSLRRPLPEQLALVRTLGGLYEAGVEVAWKETFSSEARCVRIPEYPFSRKRFWIETADAGENWVYELAWKPKPWSESYAADSVQRVTLNELIGEAEARLGRRQASIADASLAALELQAAGYAFQALQTLGCSFAIGGKFTADALRTRLGVLPRYTRLFKRLLTNLVEHDVLHNNAGTYEPTGLALRGNGEVPGVENALLRKCGLRLAEVLRGTTSPLELLFNGAEDVYAAAFHRQSSMMQSANVLFRETFDKVAQRLAHDRPIRVLEIGAGTGSTTAYILKDQKHSISEYIYTDLSRALLATGMQTFGDYPFLRFEVLDIERPVAEQGFAAAHYDIVIASNVLHATRSIRESLKHVRELLTPGGALLLLEATTPQHWYDLTFGLTEGWWRFEDTADRPDYPLVTASKWLEVLADTGFAEAAASSGKVNVIAGLKTGGAGDWLILGSESTLGRDFAVHVANRGGKAIQVSCGEQFVPGNSATRILNLWALDLTDESSPEAAAASLITSAVHLFQSLLRLAPGQAPKVWFVTRGAQHTAGKQRALSLSQSALWGFAAVAAVECPELWGGIIDLDPNSEGDDSEHIWKHVLAGDGEDRAVIRGSQRLVPRLRSSSATAQTSLELRPDATYMITGAFGGIGMHIANWMADQGAKHLVLVSRRGTGEPDSERATAVRDIEARGVSVRVEAFDIADEVKTANLLSVLAAEWPPLHGIVHAAADIRLKALDVLTDEDVRAAFGAKVKGACNLERLTRELPLDFFVLFSSISAVLGGRECADYAAANCFLDALATQCNLRGLPFLSISWGLWDVNSNSATAEQLDALVRSGLRAMSPRDALHQMERLIGVPGIAQRTIADIDWSIRKSGMELNGRGAVVSEIDASPATTPAREEQPLAQRLRNVPAAMRTDLLVDMVSSIVRRVLGLSDSDQFDPHRGFFEMGLDSLMTVDLKKRLEKSVGQQLPGTLTLNYPNAFAIAEYLNANLFGAAEAKSVQREVDDFAALSNEQARELLVAELSSLSGDLLA